MRKPRTPRSVSRRDAAESLTIGADWFGRFDDAYRLEIEEWATALHRWQPSGPTVWDGYAAQVVADAAERAMIERRPVDAFVICCGADSLAGDPL